MLGHLLKVKCPTWHGSVVPFAESKVYDTVGKCCESQLVTSAASEVCDTAEKCCDMC